MSEPWVLAAPVLILLAGLLALGLDRIALRVVRPPRRPPGRTPADEGVSFEDVRIDGAYPLRGWHIEPDGSAEAPAHGHPAAVVLAHGWAANAGVLTRLAAALMEAGHPVLLFDVRGHGRSGSAPWVTVRHFRDDVLAAASFMEARHPGRELVLGGHSMGGAAAALAAVRHGSTQPSGVAGLFLIAAPADVLEVTAAFIDARGLPGSLLVPILRPFWRIRVREPYGELVPERKLREAEDLPVLVVQPETDRRVPREHAHRLGRAAGVEPVIVQGTHHTDVLDDARTATLVADFLRGLAVSAAPA